jgi:hypothetical protein
LAEDFSADEPGGLFPAIDVVELVIGAVPARMRAIFAPAARFATHIVLTGKTARTHRTVTLELGFDLGDLGFEFLNGFGCFHVL